MYIGSTGPRGLHHLVYEVVDNSVDEAIAGYCDSVRVVLHPDNSCTVIDDGRGIPVDELKKEKRPAAEVVLTTLHAGGKFGTATATRSPAACTASASRSSTRSPSDSTSKSAATARSGPRTTSAASRRADLHRGEASDAHGTTITFLPDDEIFDELEFDYATLAERLRETAFLTRGLKIELIDERAAGQKRHLPLRGRHRRLRRPPQREQGPAAPQDGLLRERDRRRPGRGGDAVELLLPGIGLQLRQQHQHPRGRLAPLRLPLGPDPHAQRLRARQRPAQRERREPHRRRRARGADRGDLGQARRTRSSRVRPRPSSATRRSRGWSRRRSTASSASSSRRTRARRNGSSARRSTPPAPARRPARPAT